MFFSSGSFGESPFSTRKDESSSTRSSSITKNELGTSLSYFGSSDSAENRWNNNSLVTPSRKNSVSNNMTSSNARTDNPNRIQRMCLPVTISMIKRSLESTPNIFIIFGIRVSSVTIVGWITHREIFASRMIFRIADGTSGIDARFDIDSETLGDEITNYLDGLREGTLVRLVGQVIPGKADISSYISCYTIMKIENFSEYAYFHPIEVIYACQEFDEDNMDNHCNNDNSNNVSPYTGSDKNISLKTENEGINLKLIEDIQVPEDVTDKIQQLVYKTLSHELQNIENEEERSYGINKDIIIKLLKPYYEPSKILSAIFDLESKFAVIYEAMDNHYCTL